MNFKKILILILFIAFSATWSKTIQFKFKLINDFTLQTININKVKLKAIKPLQATEDEYHNKLNKKYKIEKTKFYYDSKLSCNIYECDDQYYPFNYFYVDIISDSLFYNRDYDFDYDEANCLRFDKREISKIHEFKITPYLFVDIIGKNPNNNLNCFNITLTQTSKKLIQNSNMYLPISFNNDTTFIFQAPYKTISTPNNYANDSIIKRIAYNPNKNNYVFVSFNNDSICKYYRIELNGSTTIHLKKLPIFDSYEFIIYPCEDFNNYTEQIKTEDYYK